MAILIDTHALLWWLSDSRRLPRVARRRIEDGRETAWVSAASAWEVSIKQALGKLKAPDDLLDAATESGLTWISIEPSEAMEAGRLPPHHRDPFDRLLIAQSKARSVPVVSGDGQFDGYGIQRIWD